MCSLFTSICKQTPFTRFRYSSLQSPIVSVLAMSPKGDINTLKDNATIMFGSKVDYHTYYHVILIKVTFHISETNLVFVVVSYFSCSVECLFICLLFCTCHMFFEALLGYFIDEYLRTRKLLSSLQNKLKSLH